jgi:hypothetical protein
VEIGRVSHKGKPTEDEAKVGIPIGWLLCFHFIVNEIEIKARMSKLWIENKTKTFRFFSDRT